MQDIQENFQQDIKNMIQVIQLSWDKVTDHPMKISFHLRLLKSFDSLVKTFSNHLESTELNQAIVDDCKAQLKSEFQKHIMHMKMDLQNKADRLNEQSGVEYYRQEINDFIEKVPVLIFKYKKNIFYGEAFSQFCLFYDKYNAHYQKLMGKIEKLKEKEQESELGIAPQKIRSKKIKDQTKLEDKKPTSKLIIDPNVVSGLSLLRKQIKAVIQSMRESPILNLEMGQTILTLLETHFEHLNREGIELTLTKASLMLEKQNVESFFTSHIQVLKESLTQCIQDLESYVNRGFHSLEVMKWIADVKQQLKNGELNLHTGFAALCDEYGKAYQAFDVIKHQLEQEVFLEYNQLLQAKVAMQLPIKLQAVEGNEFLTKNEKLNFSDKIKFLEKKFGRLSQTTIKKGDSKDILNYGVIEEDFNKLIGDTSSSHKRAQFCRITFNQLEKKAPCVSTDNRHLFNHCVKQALLTTGKISLDVTKENPDPLKSVFDESLKMDRYIHNFEQLIQAYEQFVLSHKLNFNHSAKGIQFAQTLSAESLTELKASFNESFKNLIQEALDQGGILSREALVQFERKIKDERPLWAKKALVSSSKESGLYRHSLNNYIRFFIEAGDKAFTEKWSPEMINERIAEKYQNRSEILSNDWMKLFSGSLPVYQQNELRTYIENVKHELELREEEKVWNQLS